MMDESLLFYYFAYGYKLNLAFLKERLKNGTWNHDGLHKTGQLDGPDPVDLGTYVLPDYVDTIVTAAENRHFPQEYIDKYLRFPLKVGK